MIIIRPMSTEFPVSPKPAAQLMLWTYIIGGIGYFVGIFTLQQDPPSLSWAALLAVTVTGILSFLRHAVFNRSDAVHGGWDYGRRNNFQIEVGLANLAWGVFALLAVIFNWGLAAVSASFLISGFYFLFVAIFIIVTPDTRQRKVGPIIGITVWGLMMVVMGSFGMVAALNGSA